MRGAISVAFGFLILGEENMVRFFLLRPLVKGRVKRENRKLNNGLRYGKLGGQRLNLPNGVNQKIEGSEVSCCNLVNSKVLEIYSNGYFEEKSEKHCDSGTQTVWISDGCNTVHMLAVHDMDTSDGESDRKDSEEKLIGISGIYLVCTLRISFRLEKLQMIPRSYYLENSFCLGAVAILCNQCGGGSY